MKINTDGVLLGAMANGKSIKNILDIGTGTGVIALMLAQRFADADIQAVEIDVQAAQTAGNNFKDSLFPERLTVYPGSFELFFEENSDRKYDLIVSNPPFYINSLLSPAKNKTLAKHADTAFFERLIKITSQQLNPGGAIWLILPVSTADVVKEQARHYRLYLQQGISIRSYPESEPHREILVFGLTELNSGMDNFVIYEEKGIYGTAYKQLLKPFFINF